MLYARGRGAEMVEPRSPGKDAVVSCFVHFHTIGVPNIVNTWSFRRVMDAKGLEDCLRPVEKEADRIVYILRSGCVARYRE